MSRCSMSNRSRVSRLHCINNKFQGILQFLVYIHMNRSSQQSIASPYYGQEQQQTTDSGIRAKETLMQNGNNIFNSGGYSSGSNSVSKRSNRQVAIDKFEQNFQKPMAYYYYYYYISYNVYYIVTEEPTMIWHQTLQAKEDLLADRLPTVRMLQKQPQAKERKDSLVTWMTPPLMKESQKKTSELARELPAVMPPPRIFYMGIMDRISWRRL